MSSLFSLWQEAIALGGGQAIATLNEIQASK
jgi:hypothetical protein